MRYWTLSTKNIEKTVKAENQYEAFDSLRDCNPSDFGLIVEARDESNPSESNGSYPCRASMLFLRWGKPEIAELAIKVGIEAGLGDTTEADQESLKKWPPFKAREP